jgi:hypothetical protein
MRLFRVFFPVLLLLLGPACTSVSSNTVSETVVLVAGLDRDPDSVARSNRIHPRVNAAIAEQFRNRGFRVADETALTLGSFDTGRERRGEGELLDIARSVTSPPVDLLVMFTVYAANEAGNYARVIRTRVAGRIVSVSTGERIASFETSFPKPRHAPLDCGRSCVLEIAGKQAEILSRDVGNVLATLADGAYAAVGNPDAGASGPLVRAYDLTFEKFTPEEVTRIEEYLVAFTGFREYRPVRVMKLHAEYWYETTSKPARLNRNLRKMLDFLGVEGTVGFAGNSFVVRRLVQSRTEGCAPDIAVC